MSWWQRIPEHIDPIALSFGVFSFWYGIAFLWSGFRSFSLEGTLSVCSRIVVFGRVSGFLSVSSCWDDSRGSSRYVLFYNVAFFAAHPIAIVSPFSIETGA